MSNLIHKILEKTKRFAQWKFLIKTNFNLSNLMRKNMDLKLEELSLERGELVARAKQVYQKQRSVESMITDLTKNIKQLEFDIDLLNIQKPHEIANSSPQSTTTRDSDRREKQEQKI